MYECGAALPVRLCLGVGTTGVGFGLFRDERGSQAQMVGKSQKSTLCFSTDPAGFQDDLF